MEASLALSGNHGVFSSIVSPVTSHKQLSNHQLSTVEKVKRVAKKVLEKFRAAWSYIGKTISLTKHTIKIYLKSSGRACIHCLKALKRLSHFSIIGAIFAAEALPKNIKSIQKSGRVGDVEGVAMGALSFFTNFGDFFDSLGTFCASIATFVTSTAVKVYLEASIFLGMAINVLSIANNTYKSIEKGAFVRDINKIIDQTELNGDKKEVIESLHAFMDHYVHPTDAEVDALVAKKIKKKKGLSQKDIEKIRKKAAKQLKEKKELILERTCGKEMKGKVMELEKLLKLDEAIDQGKLEGIVDDLKAVKAKVNNQIKLKIGAIVASLITILGLALFFSSLPTFVPFIVFAISIIIKLALVYIERNKI